MIGGIVLTSLGAIAAAVGTAAYVDAASSCVQGTLSGQVFRSNCEQSSAKLGSMTALLVGATGIAAGVPLWIYGSEKVAALPDEAPPKPAAALVIGPGAATLKITF
jgi:hypothetical protein